jgi:ABC-2 type transport system ATP-binding protein
MENPAIQTNGLTRFFGALAAVEDVSLSVAPGQFFGFLGPNGAGKSTTIKMLTGLLEPSAGTIEILGQRFGPETLELKRQIGVVPEGMALLGRLTATEYLHYVDGIEGTDEVTTTPNSLSVVRRMVVTSFLQCRAQRTRFTDQRHDSIRWTIW